MPQFGRIAASGLAVVEAEGSAPPAPWTVEGATVHTVTFEVGVDAALGALPEMLARPIPPYARIQVIDVPDSPVGAYREALLLVSCRYMMTPRLYIAAAVVSSEQARAANAQNWHYESTVGDVTLERDGNDFTSSVSDSSGLSITVSSKDALPTGTAMIRYDPTVGVWPVDGEPKVQVLSAEPKEVHEAWLARGTGVAYEGGDRGSPWLRLRSTNPITCTIAALDTERPEPSEVERPEGGGGGLP